MSTGNLLMSSQLSKSSFPSDGQTYLTASGFQSNRETLVSKVQFGKGPNKESENNGKDGLRLSLQKSEPFSSKPMFKQPKSTLNSLCRTISSFSKLPTTPNETKDVNVKLGHNLKASLSSIPVKDYQCFSKPIILKKGKEHPNTSLLAFLASKKAQESQKVTSNTVKEQIELPWIDLDGVPTKTFDKEGYGEVKICSKEGVELNFWQKKLRMKIKDERVAIEQGSEGITKMLIYSRTDLPSKFHSLYMLAYRAVSALQQKKKMTGETRLGPKEILSALRSTSRSNA